MADAEDDFYNSGQIPDGMVDASPQNMQNLDDELLAACKAVDEQELIQLAQRFNSVKEQLDAARKQLVDRSPVITSYITSLPFLKMAPKIPWFEVYFCTQHLQRVLGAKYVSNSEIEKFNPHFIYDWDFRREQVALETALDEQQHLQDMLDSSNEELTKEHRANQRIQDVLDETLGKLADSERNSQPQEDANRRGGSLADELVIPTCACSLRCCSESNLF